MTHRQRVVVTACPNGLVPGQPGKYRLSAHFAPRLTSDGGSTLADFPDWVDWPGRVNAMTWAVEFGTQTYPAVVGSAPARSDLWQSLFGGGALVRPYEQPDLAQRRVRSYPARNVLAYIQKQYTDLAVDSSEDFPHIDELVGTGGRLVPLHGLNLLVPNGTAPPGPQVETVLNQHKAYTNGPPLTNVGHDFYQIWRFHHSRTSFAPYADDDHVPPVARPTLDFHEVVSSAGQYPPLLRLLGLVVDLVVDVGGVLPASPTEVRAVPAWVPQPPPHAGSAADVVVARTRCLIDGSQFRARPREEDPSKAVLVNGRLPLHDDARFTLIQLDQDGAALKAVDFTENLYRIREGRSVATPSTYAVPSLRSGGLAVSFLNRAVDFHERMERAATTGAGLDGETPGDLVFHAEDLTRGHRIDVRDTREAKWFSLAARTGTYRFPAGVAVPYTDESWTSAGVTEDDSDDKDLYLQETLVRWGGWSLAAPRPGGRVATTQDDDPPVTTDPTVSDPDFPVDIDTFAAPGSLPRLRFGRTYRMRGRAVDVAGNSDPLDPLVEDRHATPEAPYLRFEPVQTPPVLPHAPRTEGESLERAVLRSNWNTEPAPFTRSPVARHIAPPKASQLLAEQHGLFDTAYPGSKVDPDTYAVISKYPKPVPDDPDAPVVQSEQGSFATSSERELDAEDHTKSFYYPVDVVTLPYLPDPLARGAALRFYGHSHMDNGELVKVPFHPDPPAWPAYTPFRLVLTTPNEVFNTPWFDDVARQLYVPLEKADVVNVRLSAYFGRDDLDVLGLWKWIQDRGVNVGQLGERIVDGKHWMVTPYRVLTLVHAVRQPLMVPEFGNLPVLSVSKQLNETFVRFSGSIRFSRKSTSKIDVNAAWPEYVDRGPGEGKPTAPGLGLGPDFEPKQREAVAFTVPGDRGILPLLAPLQPQKDRQEFKDTKHRRVTYTPVATTKFAEYFVESQDVVVAYSGGEMEVALNTDGVGVVPGSVKVKNKVKADPGTGQVTGAFTYAEGRHFTVDTAAGTVTLLQGGAGHPPSGTKLTISYLEPPIVRPGPGDTPASTVVSIKSSAPPAAPKVVYVVPTFGWASTKGPVVGHYTSERRGRGLRVYLERPWWSSGQDELLGVVLRDPNGDAPSASLAALLSRHGVDPVFRSTDALGDMTVFNMANGKQAGGVIGGGLPVPGVAGTVTVSGHEVRFDPVRDLWYSDIVITGNSYFPFVKLGLARFQPESVAGAHLSPVVVTDFCQLAPNRSVTVVPALDAGPGTYRVVTVRGQGYDRAGGVALYPLVRVSVERQDPNVATDLGWTQVGASVELARNPNAPLSDMEWSGQIAVPSPPAGTKQRLVIEEFERHRINPAPDTTLGLRLVYGDAIEL